MRLAHRLHYLCVVVLLAAVHVHAQLAWTRSPHNPVLTPGVFNGVGFGIDGAFDSRHALSPSVVFTNGLYRMWYVGAESYYTGQYTIGYALSEDGAVWHTYTKNPVLVPRSGFEASQVWLSVVLPDSVLTMYYSGYDGGCWRVGAAKSVTGVNWRRVPANPILDVGGRGEWDDGNVWGVSVIRMGPDDYRMWYSGNRVNGETSIGYATSSDGVRWVKHPANPVIVPGAADSWESWWVYVPRVVFADDVFHMFYLGATISGNTEIGYAFSRDGISWTKHAGNPVLTTGARGEWDSFALIDHCVLLQQNTFTIWYGGRDEETQTWQIGMATSQLSTDVHTERPLPTELGLGQSYPNPFNSATTIEYDTPRLLHVTLRVFDGLGRHVATLVDGPVPAGHHAVQWQAAGVASATYWCQMTADGKSVARKMILLK